MPSKFDSYALSLAKRLRTYTLENTQLNDEIRVGRLHQAERLEAYVSQRDTWSKMDKKDLPHGKIRTELWAELNRLVKQIECTIAHQHKQDREQKKQRIRHAQRLRRKRLMLTFKPRKKKRKKPYTGLNMMIIGVIMLSAFYTPWREVPNGTSFFMPKAFQPMLLLWH